MYPPESVGITLPIESPTCPLEFSSGYSSFLQPWHVQYDGARLEQDSTPVQILFGKLYLEHQEICQRLCKDCTAVMRSPSATLASTIAPYDMKMAASLKVTHQGPDLEIKLCPGIPAALLTCRTEITNLCYQVYPIRNHPVVIQCMSGKVAFTVVDFATSEAAGDMATHISGAEPDILKTFPQFFLEEGDALWVPAGSIPIWCGLPPTAKVEKSAVDMPNLSQRTWHVHSMAIYPVFDGMFVQSAVPVDIRTAMKASWARASQFLPNPWKANAAVKKYIDELVPEPVVV